MTTSLTRAPALTDHLIQALFDLTRADGLQVGDRLPSIKDLAARFGVSVPTMREAIQKVVSLGAIEVRHGSGMYLCQTRLPVITGNLVSHDHSDQTLIDLLDARLAIEPMLARRAATRVTPRIAQTLRAAIDGAATALTTASGKHTANMNIHLCIAQAAGNPILADTVTSMIRVYDAEQSRILAMYGPEAEAQNHAEHIAIVNAIVAGNAPRAEAAMQGHIARVLDDVTRDVARRAKGTPSNG